MQSIQIYLLHSGQFFLLHYQCWPKQKGMSEDLLDVICKTDREMRDMHFKDSHQVKTEIEEAKKDYMKEKKKYDEVIVKKQEIAQKIDQFK